MPPVMPLVIRSAIVLAILSGAIACAQPQLRPGPASEIDNPEMQSIVDADQADRDSDLGATDWDSIAERDDARRLRVRALLEGGELQTGRDFANAALVFQHGRTADDILLAHVLAMTSVAQGHADGRRLAALTLDRYLHHVGQSQVFGTQFSTTDGNDPSKWSMDPYDDGLIPDALRAINCVESRAASERLLARLKTGDESSPPPVCPDGESE